VLPLALEVEVTQQLGEASQPPGPKAVTYMAVARLPAVSLLVARLPAGSLSQWLKGEGMRAPVARHLVGTRLEVPPRPVSRAWEPERAVPPSAEESSVLAAVGARTQPVW